MEAEAEEVAWTGSVREVLNRVAEADEDRVEEVLSHSHASWSSTGMAAARPSVAKAKKVDNLNNMLRKKGVDTQTSVK